jgi:hypothetical protein
MVLVISTTCIFGGFTPIVLNFLLPSKDKEINVEDVNALTSDNSSSRKNSRRGETETNPN